MWNLRRNYHTVVSKLSHYNKFVRTIQRKCSLSLTLPDITVSKVHLGFFSEPSDQNMIKYQVLLSFKQFIYKNRADSPSVNFENVLRYLMLIHKIP